MPNRLLLEGEDLDTLVAEVQNDLGPDARIMKVVKVSYPGLRGLLRKPTFEVTVDVPDAARPSPRALARRARAAAAEDREPSTAAEEGATPATAEQQPRPDLESLSVDTVLGALRTLTGSTEAHPVGPVAVLLPPPVVPRPRPATVPPLPFPTAPTYLDEPAAAEAAPAPVHGGDLIAALRDLGVPEDLLHPAAPGRVVSVASVMHAPPPPPALPDNDTPVIVVVGAGQAPTMIAHALADRIGAPAPVPLPTGTRAGDAAHAVTWRLRTTGPIVAVCTVGLDVADATHAAAILGAVRPDQVWAVVDARVKAGDTRRWLEVLASNRRVDAVAVRALAETALPGTVLALGVPVGYLDGAPANKAAWAAVLGERLAEPEA